MRPALIWLTVVLVIAVPLIAAAASPLLAWRDPVYIAAGFAGIVGLALLLLQPLLVADALPGLRGRRVHPWIGAALVLMVLVHVAGLWITSPPDVVDVLLFRSPTPFAVWGALAMWAVVAAAVLAAARKRIGVRLWRVGHTAATTLVVVGTVVHAWLIEGAMELVSKGALCLLVTTAFAWVVWRRRAWRMFRR